MMMMMMISKLVLLGVPIVLSLCAIQIMIVGVSYNDQRHHYDQTMFVATVHAYQPSLTFSSTTITTRTVNFQRHHHQQQRRMIQCSFLSMQRKATVVLHYMNQRIDETTTSTASSPSSEGISTITAVDNIGGDTSLRGVVMDIPFYYVDWYNKNKNNNNDNNMSNDTTAPAYTPTNNTRPQLGCSIEESLDTLKFESSVSNKQPNARSNMNHHIVLITSITEHGLAQISGLQVGDIIIGVSTPFTTMHSTGNNNTNTTAASTTTNIMDVTGMNIDKVKSYIMGQIMAHTNSSNNNVLTTHEKGDDPFLILRIVRGSVAYQNHERILTELCSNPDSTSGGSSIYSAILMDDDQCVIDYVTSTYKNYDDDMGCMTSSDDGVDDSSISDDDECFMNDFHSLLWESNEEIVVGQLFDTARPSSVSSSTTTNINSSNYSSTDIKPWSSRSSPSGTFVRDPKTGQLRNIS